MLNMFYLLVPITLTNKNVLLQYNKASLGKT